MSSFQTQRTGHIESPKYAEMDYAETKSAVSKQTTAIQVNRYHRYQNLSIRPIQDEESQPNEVNGQQILAPLQQFPSVTPFQILPDLTKSNQQSQPEDVSFRYFRYSDLCIKPIESDSEGEPISILDKQSQMETVTFSQPEEIAHSQPLQKTIVKKKLRHKIRQLELRLNTTRAAQIQKWIYTDDKSLPQQCLNILTQNKKEAYEELLSYLSCVTQGREKKRMLLFYGDKQSGKKSLLFQALKTFKKSKDIYLKTYFIDLQKSSNKCQKQSFEAIVSYLKQQLNHAPQAQQKFDLFIVNGLQSFLYFLKKASLLHYFKSIISKLSRVAFIFVDSYKPNERWLQGLLKRIEMGPISIQLIASSLVAYLSSWGWGGIKWTISRSLAMFFCSKLSEQGHLNFKIISCLSSFLAQLGSQQGLFQAQIDQRKAISKNILQQFKQRYFSVTFQVSIDRLNIHQKIALIANYFSLQRNQQVLTPTDELEKWYHWACESLSLQPKSQKQFHLQILRQLEIYKLIKVIKKVQKRPQSWVLLKISVNTIRQTFSVDSCLCKFFQQVS